MEQSVASSVKLKVLMIFLLLLGMLGVREASAQEMSVYKLHSLFLYNFTKHVKWENEVAPFTIGVYGSTSAFNALKENLSAKTQWGLPIKLVQVNSPVDANQCHLMYFPKSNKKSIIDFIAQINSKNTLMVTEEDMTAEGAAISFIYQDSKMTFKIDKGRLEASGLKVSNSLLSIGVNA